MIKYLLLILAVVSCSVKDEELIVEITPQISGVEASFGSGIAGKRKLMVRLNLNDNSNIIDGVDLNPSLSSLQQNYPNPVNGKTEIVYELANSTDVNVDITDMTGRTVLSFNEGNKPAGKHSLQVNTIGLEAGVYFYTLKAGNFIDTKRMSTEVQHLTF